MATHSERTYRQRLSEFDGPIADMAHYLAPIQDMMRRYAVGQIVTKEEALSQMVLALGRGWEEEMKRRRSPFPPEFNITDAFRNR